MNRTQQLLRAESKAYKRDNAIERIIDAARVN